MGKFFEHITAAATHLLVLTVVFEVIARYFFGKSSAGISDVEVYAFSFIILFGGSLTFLKDAHVRIDLFYGKLTGERKKIIHWISILLFLLPFCAVIAFTSYEFAQVSYAFGEKSTDPGGFGNRFLLKSFIPLSFGLLFFVSLTGLLTRKKDTDENARGF
jgi:TRAP-type mannitol/chloroaromatic compound transport system permease small subunit